MSEENEPVTKAFLESKLKLFHSQLELERSERALKKLKRYYFALMVLIIMTLYFFVLLGLLQWTLAK